MRSTERHDSSIHVKSLQPTFEESASNDRIVLTKLSKCLSSVLVTFLLLAC